MPPPGAGAGEGPAIEVTAALESFQCSAPERERAACAVSPAQTRHPARSAGASEAPGAAGRSRGHRCSRLTSSAGNEVTARESPGRGPAGAGDYSKESAASRALGAGVRTFWFVLPAGGRGEETGAGQACRVGGPGARGAARPAARGRGDAFPGQYIKWEPRSAPPPPEEGGGAGRRSALSRRSGLAGRGR